MTMPIFLQGPKGSFIIFDYIVSILAIFGNSLILESVLKVQFDLTGYRRFLISLAISDLYICFVNIMTFVHSAVIMYSPDPELQKCGSDILRSMQFCGFFANLLNLCGMSVDHFIGIVYPLRYCDFMSPRIARIAVASIWAVSLIIGFADYPISLGLFLTRSPNAPYSVASSTPTDTSNNYDYTSGTSSGSIFNTDVNTNSSLVNGNDFMTGSGDNPNGYNNSSHQDLLRYGGLPAYSDDNSTTAGSNSPIAGAGAGPINDGIDVSEDIDAILWSIVGGNFPSAKFGISVNASMKDRLKNILNVVVQPKKDEPGWCTILHPTRGWLEFSVMTMTLICFAFLSICYGRIFKEVFGNVDPTERNTRKLVITTFLLLGAFTICWMPFMVFEFIMIITFYANSSAPSKAMTSSASLFIVHNAFNSMLICAPLIDPLIYSVRMRIIRRYILMRYKKMLPCCRPCIEKALIRRSTFYSGQPAPPTSRGSLATNYDRKKGSEFRSSTANRQFVEINGDGGQYNKNHGSDLQSKNKPSNGEQDTSVTDPLIGKSNSIIVAAPAIYTSGNRFKRHLHERDKQFSHPARRHSNFDNSGTAELSQIKSPSGLNFKQVNSGAGSDDNIALKGLNETSSQVQFLPFPRENSTNPINGETRRIISDAIPENETTQGCEPPISVKSPSSENNVPGLPQPSAETDDTVFFTSEPDAEKRCLLATPEHSDMSTPRLDPLNSKVYKRISEENDEKNYVDDSEMTVADLSLPSSPIRLGRVIMKPIEFSDSDAVYRKFRDNASRLLHFDDDPGNNAITLARLARHPRSEVLPRKQLSRLLIYGKSPTMGDLSTPSEDLFIVTTKC